MAMTLLKARKTTDGTFHLAVHLDSSKLVNGEPDPAYIRKYDWGPTPQGMTQADYVTQIKTETKLLAQHELAHIVPEQGTALPGEGATL